MACGPQWCAVAPAFNGRRTRGCAPYRDPCRSPTADRGHGNVTKEPSAATEIQVLSCSTLDRPELGPRLFGRDLQLVDLPGVLLGELDEFALGSLRGPAALALHPVLHAPTSSRAGY